MVEPATRSAGVVAGCPASRSVTGRNPGIVPRLNRAPAGSPARSAAADPAAAYRSSTKNALASLSATM